jgi:hypothetical protein
MNIFADSIELPLQEQSDHIVTVLDDILLSPLNVSNGNYNTVDNLLLDANPDCSLLQLLAALMITRPFKDYLNNRENLIPLAVQKAIDKYGELKGKKLVEGMV